MALPTVSGTTARRVIDQFAADHAEFEFLIHALGTFLLERASCGLRDGRKASKTYDLSFVGSHGSFACITAEHGKYNRIKHGLLRVEARFDGTPAGLEVFEPQRRPSGRKRGWHFAQLNPESAGIAALRRDLQKTYQ